MSASVSRMRMVSSGLNVDHGTKALFKVQMHWEPLFMNSLEASLALIRLHTGSRSWRNRPGTAKLWLADGGTAVPLAAAPVRRRAAHT